MREFCRENLCFFSCINDLIFLPRYFTQDNETMNNVKFKDKMTQYKFQMQTSFIPNLPQLNYRNTYFYF